MKDVLSLTVFAGKVLCLVIFVARPEVHQHWRSSDAGETRQLQNRTVGTAGMRADPPCSDFNSRCSAVQCTSALRSLLKQHIALNDAERKDLVAGSTVTVEVPGTVPRKHEGKQPWTNRSTDCRVAPAAIGYSPSYGLASSIKRF